MRGSMPDKLPEYSGVGGQSIAVTQHDIRELQLAKGAIRCGIETLLQDAGISAGDLDKVIIAGAFGTYIDVESAITIGLLMAFTQYITKLFQPINDFSEKFNVLQGALAGAERIFDLMDQEPEDYRDDLACDVKLKGAIAFQNVWLAYNPGEWVLKDVSFKIKPGEKIALVGHTGSGKTAIVNLVLGMYPFQKGEILLDGKEEYIMDQIEQSDF